MRRVALESSRSNDADGRRARSERTRTAIVDALLALLDEGDVRPSAERIAERAGVSRRALFNHFRDVEDLLATAAQRQVERLLPTLRPLPVDGTLAERAAGVANLMGALHERVAPVRRAALLAEHESPAIAERLAEMRRMHRTAIHAAFAPELAACPPEERRALGATIAMLASFPAWEELTAHQRLSAAHARDAVRAQLVAALTPYNRTK